MKTTTKTTTTGPRAAMKSAIITTSNDIRGLRAGAQRHFAEARRLRAAGDADAALAATLAGNDAHWQAHGLAPEARLLLATYAFARGRTLASIEGSRRRAAPLKAGDVRASLAAFELPAAESEIASWLVGEPLAPAPALPVVLGVAGAPLGEGVHLHELPGGGAVFSMPHPLDQVG